MNVDKFVDKSLDDYIRANRRIFSGRGRGGPAVPGRGRPTTTYRRGARGGRSGRGGGGGGDERYRSPLRRSAGAAVSVSRGRARTRSRPARGRGQARGRGRGSGSAGSSFSQRWRTASARMGSHLRGARRAATSRNSQSPIKRKQVSVRARRGGLSKTFAASPGRGLKAVTALALKKKRQAVRQLTNDRKQLLRADARNLILLKRRGLTAAAGGGRGGGGGRGRGSVRTRTGRGRRGAAAATAPRSVGRVQVFHEPAAPTAGRARRRLNRNRLRPPGAALPAPPPPAGQVLTIRVKNELANLRPNPPPPPPPLPVRAAEPDREDTPPRRQLDRSALNPRIQQEIAAIQARGRTSQGRPAGGVANFRPTAAASGRSLNDRFTQDRVIYS